MKNPNWISIDTNQRWKKIMLLYQSGLKIRASYREGKPKNSNRISITGLHTGNWVTYTFAALHYNPSGTNFNVAIGLL